MEKEFVPYELALDLKELGFDEPCFAWTLPEQENFIISPCEKYGDRYDKMIQIPLYQQAFRFIREKYGYDVSIKKKKFEIEKLEIYGESDPDYYFIDFPFDSYEESELECLKKLIEIVKRKKI
jgi:hypothetical protein